MSRSLKLAALAVLGSALLWNCSGGSTTTAQLTIAASPGAIVNKADAGDDTSTLRVEGLDESGKPGTGKVTVTSTAGSLRDAGQSIDLDSKGQGTLTFTCFAAADKDCSGSVKISAEWARTGGSVFTSRFIVVSGPVPDAGVPDAGGVVDAGGTDAGQDAGPVGDGGTTVNTVTLTPVKPALVINTGDSTEVTAKVTVTATGAAVAGTLVSFTTDRGSFAAAPGVLTATAMTDAMGNAKVVLSTAGATAGPAALAATALDGRGQATVSFVSVASIVPAPDSSVKTILGIQSGGRETTTPILFKVLDALNMPAKDVLVSFATGTASPGGTSVTPSGVSDAMGIVRTTLQSGNAVGVVTVVATVTATATVPSPISASTTVQIVGGKPSYRGLVIDCARKNMGALTKPGSVGGIPTRPLKTDCTANLSDRFTNPVLLPTQVSWFAERGTIGPATSVMGIATSAYDTTANSAPNDVAPLMMPAEPFNGTKNPRDMIISIIGVVGGEEEFTDVNANGKWDPGEWFLDLPEPFVDDNDNQVWDVGEARIDTDRLNCVTGMIELPNGKWDGPNGCWDANTQIFATTHVTWSGVPSQPIAFAQPPPWTVAVNQVRLINFTWADDYFNPMSPDSPSMSATLLPAMRGSAVVSAPGLVGDGLGHAVAYEKVEATEAPTLDGGAGSGNFTINGICDASKPGPTNRLTRCLARYRFVSFGTGSAGQLQLTGGAPQAALPDGGVAPPVAATVNISAQNQFFTPVTQSFGVTFE